jgi:hypothetical protein
MVYKLIQEAERKSSQICEECGNPGRLVVKKLMVKARCHHC